MVDGISGFLPEKNRVVNATKNSSPIGDSILFKNKTPQGQRGVFLFVPPRACLPAGREFRLVPPSGGTSLSWAALNAPMVAFIGAQWRFSPTEFRLEAYLVSARSIPLNKSSK
ncbi:MAG: hypothetical protein WC447_03565 [Candidatus Paceibacterota bacterium]